MTTFDRSGHYRTSSNGAVFWVESHAVTRDDWPTGLTRPVSRAYQANDLTSFSENITIPNARCPGCGSQVFFFEAANGGRVFFNDLGSPWDKHDCGYLSYSHVQAFDSPEGVLRWRRARRVLHPAGVRDEDLGLRPGTVRATAYVTRRSGASAVVVDYGSEKRAYTVDTPWDGSEPRMVYVRRSDEAREPISLDWLNDDLQPVSIKILSEIQLPGPPSIGDMPEIAAEHVPEAETWTRRYLRPFARRGFVRMDGHRVGLIGDLQGCRCAVMPLAPTFTGSAGLWSSPRERYAACETVVTDWTARLLRSLGRRGAMPAHPLRRDQIIWLVPRYYDDDAIGLFVDCVGRRGKWGLEKDQIRGSNLPPSHRVFDLSEAADIDWHELRTSFSDLKELEDKHVQMLMKSETAKHWLTASLRRTGLKLIMDDLQAEGVQFLFGTRPSVLPGPWYQQARLPDGRHLLVLLHRSTAEQGLCFASFGRGRWIAGRGIVHDLQALFHAKRLRTIKKELPAEGVA